MKVLTVRNYKSLLKKYLIIIKMRDYKEVVARAPVRICDIGGWTDTWYYPEGAVFNFCIDLYSYVRILESGKNSIRIFAENLGKTVMIDRFEDIEYNGELDLIKAAIKRLEIEGGLDIYVKAEAPPGCGTGTSASIAVTLVSALATYKGLQLNPKEISTLAHKLETEELGLESGVQDQYAAAFGGINFMEVKYPNVKLTNIKLRERRIFELESQFILVYLSSRSSSEMHTAVIKNYKRGDPNTLNSFDIMKECAYNMKNAIYSDIIDVGKVMNRNWEAQKKLHPLMVNTVISKAEEIAKNNGAIGFKCNGAGGGGTVIILAERGQELQIRTKLLEKGYHIIPFKLCFNGVSNFAF
jgi:D-glycero-alpha-D-manno-heptose-7-phosphate kinase